MCTRFTLTTSIERLAEEFGFHLGSLAAFTPRFNVAPSLAVLAVRAGEAGAEPFAPVWGVESRSGPSLVNARVESAFEKPSFREALETRRCLVPADGFYEWRTEAGGKQPYLFSPESGRPLALAAIYTRAAAGAPERCLVLTTESRGAVQEIHPRMPVVVDPADYAAWLDPARRTREALAAVLEPKVTLVRRPVTRRVNDPRNEGPELHQPPVQTSLF